MLLYKGGRFYAEGVSFLVPDGFYMETVAPIYYEDGFITRDSTQAHTYDWAVFPVERTAKKEMEDRADSCERLISPVAPIQINGLSGYWLTFAGTSEYYEAQFDLPNHTTFMLLVDALGDSIQDVMATPDFQAALHGIRAELLVL